MIRSDQLDNQFDLVRAKVHEWLYKLILLLYKIHVTLEMMPEREVWSSEELIKALDGIDEVIIDAIEWLYRRPQEAQVEQDYLSCRVILQILVLTFQRVLNRVVPY